MIKVEDVPFVSVVIPHYNHSEKLVDCIESVLQTEYPKFEVIVVDDRSTDNSFELVKERFSSVKLLRTPTNSGFGTSCNLGASNSTGTVLVFLNNDTKVDSLWLLELMNTMKKDNASIATPKILGMPQTDTINSAGGVCDIFGVGWNRYNGFADFKQFRQSDEVFYGSACLAVTKPVWERLGGFDEDYFMYVEDVDFCWRAKLLGFKTIFANNAIVYHKWRDSEQDPLFIFYYVARNSLMTILKNYSTISLIFILPVYCTFKAIELVYFSVKSRKMFYKLAGALKWNLKSIGNILAKREEVQKTRVINDLRILKHMKKVGFESNLILKKFKHPLIDVLVRNRR